MTRKEATSELIYKDESYAIIGACFAVYKEKGCGFLEAVYLFGSLRSEGVRYKRTRDYGCVQKLRQ